VPQLSIQRLLGHTSSAMLKRYAKQTPDDLREEHDRGSVVDDL
jgi:hypothetical protein